MPNIVFNNDDMNEIHRSISKIDKDRLINKRDK